MEINRGAMKAPLATDWVTVADTSGTGTGIVSSADIAIPFSALPSFINPVLEVEVGTRKSAGTGMVRCWVVYASVSQVNVTENAAATLYATNYAVVSDVTILTKKFYIQIPVLAGHHNVVNQSQYCLVKGAGTAADTGWTIQNIKARLIYTPI